MANVVPIIREAHKAGATSLREIAAALNARGGACPFWGVGSASGGIGLELAHVLAENRFSLVLLDSRDNPEFGTSMAEPPPVPTTAIFSRSDEAR